MKERPAAVRSQSEESTKVMGLAKIPSNKQICDGVPGHCLQDLVTFLGLKWRVLSKSGVSCRHATYPLSLAGPRKQEDVLIMSPLTVTSCSSRAGLQP